MKKKTFTPNFDNLDEEERKMEEENARGEWVTVDNLEEEKLKLQMAAKNTPLKKQGVATFPVSVPFDLYQDLEKKAQKEKTSIGNFVAQKIKQYA